MSRFTNIQNAILSLSPGDYQRLCSEYIMKKKCFTNMHDIGAKEGTNKTTRGIPDSYAIYDDGRYSLIMYGTVEKKSSIKKIESDIKDAHNEKKTKIPICKVKEIICFHINTNISPGECERLTNLFEDVHIELIDIDTMAHDICNNYTYLATDYLQLPIDTNQISDIDTFIKRYDKYSTSSPLSNTFIERQEKNEILEKIEKTEKMLLIKGKPGVGKTKLALEVCKELEKKDNLKVLCIRLNGADIYEDMKISLDNTKKYIVFIDDINESNYIQNLIDLIVTNDNENIKIIATIRDYFANEIVEKLNKYLTPVIYSLNKMTDDDITKIIQTSFNTSNKKLQQQLLKISNGNPRIAIMTYQAMLIDKNNSIDSILDVYKVYYDNIIKQNKLSNLQVKILFYISLFSPFNLNSEEIINTLNDFNSYNWDEFKKLRDLELIEIYNNIAIKISDQNFANYIIYKYLIEDKTIKFSDLLIKTYPKFIKKIVNIINMLNELFGSEKTYKYIFSEINSVWQLPQYQNDDLFFKYFHNANISKSLEILYSKINNTPKSDFSNNIKYNSNIYINDEIIEILSDIGKSDSYKLAFNLLLLYLERNPKLYNEICKSIIDSWVMNKSNLDFKKETEIISIILKKYLLKNEFKEIYELILINTIIKCLNTKLELNEPGKNIRTINIVTILLIGTDKLFKFREFLFNTLIELSRSNPKILNYLMDYSIWSYNENQKDIFIHDIQYLNDNLFNKWKKPNLQMCKILSFIKNNCEEMNVAIPKSTLNIEENKEFKILNCFESYQSNKTNEKLTKLLINSNTYDYEQYFQILKKVSDEKIKVDSWKIESSLNLLFEYILKNKKSDFDKIIISYLSNNCPFKSYPIFLSSVKNKEHLIDLLLTVKNDLTYFFLAYLLNEYYSKKYLKLVYDFILNQSNSTIIYTLNFQTLIKYSKFEPNIIDKYTKDINEINNLHLAFSYIDLIGDDLDTATMIYNNFKDKSILECYYLNILNTYNDDKGLLGFLLVKNNYNFFIDLINQKKPSSDNTIPNIVENIWKDECYDSIVLKIYNKILESQFGYLTLHYLFECTDEVQEIQNNWIKKYITNNSNNLEKIEILFHVICEKDEKSKKMLILHLLNLNSNIEYLKHIQFFSRHESWNDSRIPLIEKKISFLKDIKNELEKKQDIHYIPHINYLDSSIQDLEKCIEKTKIEEYLSNFFE